MRMLALCFFVMFPNAFSLAETNSAPKEVREPGLYEHFLAMQQSQENVSRLSLDEQQRFQPKIRQAEQRACQRLKKDQQEGIGLDDYRGQGGDEFAAYVQQFERYCETLR